MVPISALSCAIALRALYNWLRHCMPLVLFAVLALGASPGYAQVEAGGPTIRPMAPPPPSEEGTNGATVYSQAVPSVMVIGRTYNVSVRMLNGGSNEWSSGAGYLLASRSPDWNTTWGLNQVGMSGGAVPYWGTQTFNFAVTAPTVPGTYTFDWGMYHTSSGWFGYTSPLAITVREPINNAEPSAQNVPTQMEQNKLYNVSVAMLNNGETTWSAAKAYSLGSQNPQDNSVWGGGRVGLPADIAPGQTAVFNFQVRAPQTTGPANFQWRMVRDGYEWFGAYSSNVVVNVTPTPRNDAALMGQTVPAQMVAGQSYPVTAVMRNTGTTTWTQAGAYSLAIFQSSAGHSWVNVGRAALPHSVAPGQDVSFSFNVAAPSALGNYPFAFQMVQDGVELFGAVSNSASVNVVAVPSRNDAVVAAVTVPPRMTTGQMYPVTIVMQNTGNTTWSAGTLHRLGEAGGHGAMWGIERVALATAVSPGQQYTFTFQVTAPAAGLYDMQWRMVQDGLEFFGAPAGSQVTVTEDLSRVTFIHTDGLGSPVARTDGAGTVLSRTRYEPYGYVAAGTTPTIGFTGHVNDADTGLTYMQQRYYDPVAGRFLSVDPVTTDANTGGSFNRYNYANNNPFSYIDPDGRDAEAPIDRRRNEQEEKERARCNANCNMEIDRSSGSERTWGSYLPGTAQGHESSMYWADRINRSDFVEDPLARVGLGLSVLWTPDTAVSTAITLGTGGLYTAYARYAIGAETPFSWGRIATWGNRTGHPTGRYPHYHRRVYKKPGKVAKGQGMGRHRPWDKDPVYDKSFWDRF